jgi:predicted RNase H-like nuclease (RuvC/YqgF family)
VKFIKLEPRASTSQMEELVHLTKSSYMAKCLMELAEVLEKPDESAVQLEVLQKANTDLQAQLENYKTQLETVTIRHGNEKTKWANLFHDSNQKVTTTKVALRSAESKITSLELQLQLANSRISQVGTASPTDEMMHMVDMRGKGVALEVGPAITKWEEDGQSFQDWQMSLHFLYPYVTDPN